MEEKLEPESESSQLPKQNDESAESTELVDQIESELVDNPVVLERLLDRPRVMALVKRTVLSGPLPPPNMLREYKDVIENGAERIMQMTESEQEHRHKVTEAAVIGAIDKDQRGQWMAFAITIFILIIAVVFALRGEMWFAGTLIAIDLIGLASVFAIGRQDKKPK